MTAFNFAIGGGGDIQLVEVIVEIPTKVETSPFNTKWQQDTFHHIVMKESFTPIEVDSRFNDYMVTETFTPIESIKFNIREF
jgi:hypothetical protein